MSEMEPASSGGSAPLSGKPSPRSRQDSSDAAVAAKIESLERMVQNVVAENEKLRRLVAAEDRRIMRDPAARDGLVQKRLEKNRKQIPGRFRWAVRPPGWRIEVEFNCDFDNENDAKRVYVDRFRTEFREGHAVNNHQIRLVGQWIDGNLVREDEPAAKAKQPAKRRVVEVR